MRYTATMKFKGIFSKCQFILNQEIISTFNFI